METKTFKEQLYEEHPKDPKHFPLWLAILVLLSIGTGAVFAYDKLKTQGENLEAKQSDTPSPSDGEGGEEVADTSDWQTYRNEEYGFEFKYPKEWIVNDGSYITNSIFRTGFSYQESVNEAIESLPSSYNDWDEESKLLEISTKGLVVSFGLDIYKNDNPDNLQIREWFDKKYDYGQGFSSIPYINQDVKVGEIDVVKIAVQAMGTQIEYYIPKGKDVINIGYSKSDKYDPIYDQILSTFKFIEPTSSGSDSEVCAQVITPAFDPSTGEERMFPTPCDVPDGWMVLGSFTEN